MSIEKTLKKLQNLEEELKKVVIGRDDIIEKLVLALASNQHILIIGTHGEAKSFVANKLGKASGLNCYSAQIHQETIVKDIVGLLNPVAYNKGEIDIIKTPFWNSEILFFDEILRGRTEMLDFLLEIMVERKTSKTLLGNVDLPVLSVIATTNPLTEEYNTERLDLALKDRFFAILNIDHLIKDESNQKYIKTILENQIDDVQSVNLKREELIEFAKEAKKVEIDTNVVVEIFANANEEGFAFSTRFIKMFKEICQTYALMHGKKIVERNDFFEIGKMMILNRFDNFKPSMIDDCIDEALLKTSYSDLLDKIKETNELKDDSSNSSIFLEKSLEIIEFTNSIYPTMSKRIQEMIDNIISNVEEKVKMNLGTSLITPKLLAKLDTEKFKHIIEDYIKHKTIETKYLALSEYKEVKKILKLKFCDISKIKTNRYIKIKVIPKINVPESFEEIENVLELFKRYKLLSVV